MGLAEQFDLLELLHRDVAETWLAVEKGSERRLLLHQFKEDTGLRERLISMAPNDLIMLVSAEKQDDSYIVVTHDFPALRQFRDWIEGRRSAPPPPKAHPVAAPRDPPTPLFDPARTQHMPRKVLDSGGSGEFTRVFRGSHRPLKFPPTEGPAPTPPSTPTIAEPVGGAGEFVRMFQTPTAAAATSPAALRGETKPVAASSPVLPNELSAAKTPVTEPGEFTRIFQTPANAPLNTRAVLQNEPNAGTASSLALPNEPGVTRVFRPSPAAPVNPAALSRNEPNPVAGSPLLPNELPAAKTPVTEPGEFTRIFQTPANAPLNTRAVLRNEPNAGTASSPALPSEPGDTRVFRPATAGPVNAPAVLRNEPSAVAPSNPVLGSEPSAARAPAAEPGEFTRMFQPPVAPPLPSLPNPPSGSGEFTRIFSNQLPTTPLAEKLDLRQPKARDIAQPRASGEFTRTFGQFQQPSNSGMPPLPYGITGSTNDVGATGIFSGVKTSERGSMQPSVPPRPSEYTRILRPSAGFEPAYPAPPKANSEKKLEPQPKKQQEAKFWPLVIVLAVLAIAALLLLVYVLRER